MTDIIDDNLKEHITLFHRFSCREIYEMLYITYHKPLKSDLKKAAKKFYKKKEYKQKPDVLIYLQTILISLSESSKELIENITTRSLVFLKSGFYELSNQDLDYLYKFREISLNYFIVKSSLLVKLECFEESIECLRNGLKYHPDSELIQNKLNKRLEKQEKMIFGKKRRLERVLEKDHETETQLECFKIPEFIFLKIEKRESLEKKIENIVNLPDDVIQHQIFSYFDDVDYVLFSHVCYRWRNIAVKAFNDRFRTEFETFVKEEYPNRFIYRESMMYCEYVDRILTYTLKVYRYFYSSYNLSNVFKREGEEFSHQYLGQNRVCESIFRPKMKNIDLLRNQLFRNNIHIRKFYSLCDGINRNSSNFHAQLEIFNSHVRDKKILPLPELVPIEEIISERKLFSNYHRVKLDEDSSWTRGVKVRHIDFSNHKGLYLQPNLTRDIIVMPKTKTKEKEEEEERKKKFGYNYYNYSEKEEEEEKIMYYHVLMKENGSVMIQECFVTTCGVRRIWNGRKFNDHPKYQIRIKEKEGYVFEGFGKFTRYLFNYLCFVVVNIQKKILKTGKFKNLIIKKSKK